MKAAGEKANHDEDIISAAKGLCEKRFCRQGCILSKRGLCGGFCERSAAEQKYRRNHEDSRDGEDIHPIRQTAEGKRMMNDRGKQGIADTRGGIDDARYNGAAFFGQTGIDSTDNDAEGNRADAAGDEDAKDEHKRKY